MEYILKTAENRWKNILCHSWSVHLNTPACWIVISLHFHFQRLLLIPARCFESPIHTALVCGPSLTAVNGTYYVPVMLCYICYMYCTRTTAGEGTEAVEVKAELRVSPLLKTTLQ